MFDGKVIQVGGSGDFGPHFVETSSKIAGKYYKVDYGHMSQNYVIKDQQVIATNKIGAIGRLGIRPGMPTHVHIAIWRPLPGALKGFVMPWWK